jgi:hypothetical protein
MAGVDGEGSVDGHEPRAHLMYGTRDEAGSSLLGILLVLIILGTLAGLVYVTMGAGTGPTTRFDMVPEPGEEGNGGSVRAPRAIAGAGACRANYQAVDAAQAAKNAKDGSNAASVAELVREGWLSAPPETQGYTIDLEVVDGQPTGRVLVNGAGGIEVCDSLP